LSSLSVKIVELSVNNNLRGGAVGNLLYGGSVWVCANADIEIKQKIENISFVFMLQRNFIIHYKPDFQPADNFPFTLCHKAW
jgi:hypothetical protein